MADFTTLLGQTDPREGLLIKDRFSLKMRMCSNSIIKKIAILSVIVAQCNGGRVA